MAQVFRPSYTTIDPKTGKRVKCKSRTWWIRYYTPDGIRHRVKGYRDRKATETYAAELERRGIRLDAGVVDPTDEHAKKPLREHADDFRRYLAGKGNTEEYVGLVLFRLTALLEGCRFVRSSNIHTSAVVEYLARLRQGDGDTAGKSVKTANEYLAAVKGFSRWLWRDRRIVADPLAGLAKLTNGAADVRHARRDYSPDELRWLLETTRQSVRPFRRLTGLDRFTIYLTAAATGFRTSELATMTPASFDMDRDTPTATVQAACTKNRKEAVQPLPQDVAAVLRDYLADKSANQPVWSGTWANDASAKMLRRDLADARAAWLESFQDAQERTEAERSDFLAYCDSERRYTDFHALRHTFITMVGKSGVSAREHMDLARHSSYTMTARYSHSRFYDLAAAVQGLPIPTGSPDADRQALRATGTDGRTHQILFMDDGPNLVPQAAKTGDFLRLAETEERRSEQQAAPGKHGVSAVFQGHAPDRSKVEAAGIEPASRGTSVPASTCVAGLCSSSALVFAFPIPGRQGLGLTIGQEV
jgi:integrase